MSLPESIAERTFLFPAGLGAAAIGSTVYYVAEKGPDPYALATGMILGGHCLASALIMRRRSRGPEQSAQETIEIDSLGEHLAGFSGPWIGNDQWLRRNHP